ncbi:MAG TPA: GAF domain-containing sensor histidine kinase [Candidatus Sulfotelmatobacter sp.]|jgi:signal transduction histidine kinase|nr:GAF domain-containing sensor histidine kinase [Candidatus Sulfotelmatobacter sp.]
MEMSILSSYIPYIPWVLFYGIALVYIVDSLRSNKHNSYYKEKAEKNAQILAEREKALFATAALNAIILETLDYSEAIKKIASALPQYLGYETGVLAIVNEKKGTLDRVGLSSTSGGFAAVKVLEKPFASIEIKLTASENYCIKAMQERRTLYTNNLYDVVRPALSPENAKIVQEKMNTKTTLIFPLFSKKGKPIGTFIISMSKDYAQISEFEHQTIKNFIDSVQIALNNASLYTLLETATKQLQDANKKLTELDKLKNEFVSVASHELRTPMTAIKSYLWMALNDKGGQLNEKQRYYVERGYNSVDRLIRLVNDMLNISRIESGRIIIDFQSTDLLKLTQEVVEEVLPRALEVGVEILIQKPATLPPVLADPDKIKEVLFNLIGNSLKFTPKGGHITISFSEWDDFVQTKIVDTGSGITSEDIGKLFQKFGLLPGSYITNQTAAGTGLGLYICRSIINLHYGEIKATSEGRGKGATFSFSLKKFKEADLQNVKIEALKEQKDTAELIHAQF